MALTTTHANMVLGPRSNSKQMIFGIPAGLTADTPGVLCLEGISDALVYNRVYLWADNSNNLRYSTTKPTDQDGSGSVLATTAATGANYTLSNLGTVAINTTLLSDTTATDDIGSSTVYWKDLYIGRIFLTATCSVTATLAVATLTGSLTLADGDIVITEGKMTVTSVTDEGIVFTRNQATTTTPWVTIRTQATSDDRPALLINADATGAIDAMQITTDAAGGSGLNITTANAAGQNLAVVGPASQTASMILVDGTTGSWLGANGVGMLHLRADGTLAHANASLLNITHTGTVAAGALGSSLRIVDSATAAGTDYAVHMTSSTNNVLYLLTTTATTTTALTVKGTAAGTASIGKIDATDWVGASAVGALHISGDGVLVAGASLLNVTSTAANTAASYLVLLTASGAYTNSTNGTALRVVDSGAAAGTSYATYITSTANHALCLATGAVTRVCLTLAPVTATTAAVINVAAGAWVGATGVGAVTISGSGTLAHANASLLLIANSGATSAAAALGSSLRITDTSGASAGGYVAYITSTSNACLGLVGVAVAKNQLYIGGPASQTASMINVVSTNVNATNIGTVHIANSGNLAHANATNLFVTQTGTVAANTLGGCARFVDASAASATSYAVQVTSTANGLLNLTGVATAYPCLNITGGTSATASVVNIVTTSVNATGIGTLSIVNTGILAHANATNLYIYQNANVANATLGSCARFVDASAAATTSAAVQITSTNNRALACTVGQADFADGIATRRSTAACAGAAPTQAELVTAFGAANTHTAGWIGILDTSDTKEFLVYCDGVQYSYGAALVVPA